MNRYFTLFDFSTKDELNNYIKSSTKQFLCNELKDLLSTSNVSFVLSGINRLQSTLLCEAGFSYVQQSQRYVPMTSDFVKLLDNTPQDIVNDGIKLVFKSLDLYTEMTVTKIPNKKGRPEVDDFVHGISYEDARSILPLSISTNIVTSMSGDRLIDLVSLFIKYPLVFRSLMKELETLIPKDLYTRINRAAISTTESDHRDGDSYFKHKMSELTLDNNVILLGDSDYVAISALASQSTESPDKKYESWGDNAEANSKKLIANVVGYSHTGILEHSRNTFAMQCSLSAYHQLIRHRIQNIRRESLHDIIVDIDREYIIPDSIKNNEYFNNKVIELINLYKAFYVKYMKKYDYEFLMQFMLNAKPIRFVVSSNIRNDNNIFKDRLCYTAQSEIRNLYLKKFKILYDIYPNLVKYGLPPCVINNKCKEGRLTCSHMNEVLEKYSEFIKE